MSLPMSTNTSLDLLSISRSTDRIKTVIDIGDKYDYEPSFTIALGEVTLTEGDGNRRGRWSLRAYWANGVTDSEHDSAYILWLPLVGIRIDNYSYGALHLHGFLAGSSDDFRVPPADYENLVKSRKGYQKCTSCNGESVHYMVPEGFYVPPKNPELFNKFAGRHYSYSLGWSL